MHVAVQGTYVTDSRAQTPQCYSRRRPLFSSRLVAVTANRRVDLITIGAGVSGISRSHVVGAGFFPVLIISWVYEMTPEGIKRELVDSCYCRSGR